MDINQTETKLVVEGLLIDSMMRHEVKLSTTIGLYDQNEIPLVNDASVIVTEITPQGIETVYPYLQEDEDGHYYSESAFRGVVGNTYKLEIDWNGQTYQASDVLLPVTDIDSLRKEPVDEDVEISQRTKDTLGTDTGPFYWVKFYAYEPPERVDYYHWRFYRNGVFKNYEGDDVYYASDEIVDSNIDGIYIPGVYTTNDTIHMEQFSLTRIGYLYYYDLETVLYSDGGMYSPPPANPRTNLSNGALGFWQVSAMKNITYVVP